MKAEVEYFLLNSSGMPDGTVQKTMVAIHSAGDHNETEKEVTQALSEKLGKNPEQFEIMLFTVQEESNENHESHENHENHPEKEIQCELSPRMGDYEGVFLQKDDEYLLELRVSGMALMNEECGLKNVTIRDWLCETAMSFVEKMSKYEVLLIEPHDVKEGKLITSWENLQRGESTLKINEKK